MNKVELIALVEARRQHIESALAQQTSEQLDHKIQGEWTFKDTLAHIAYGDAELVNWLEKVQRNEYVAPQTEDDDTINARVYHANRGRPQAEVVAEFRAVYQRLANFLAQATEDQINQPSPTVKNWSLASHIVSNMEHVDEHLAPVAVPKQ